jgi:hypothetical protein
MKKILPTLLILSLTSTTFFTQEKSWSIGLVGSPNFYAIKSPKGFNHTYHSEIGYSFGLEATRSKNDKLDIGFGLNNTSVVYEAEYNFIPPDTGVVDSSLPLSSKINISYLDIPLFLRLRLISGDKTSFYSSFAIMSSIKIREDDKTLHEDNSIKPSNSVRSFLLGGKIGLGIAYKLNDKLLIKIEPSLTVYLNGFDSYMNYFPKIFQSIVGVEYKIVKQE